MVRHVFDDAEQPYRRGEGGQPSRSLHFGAVRDITGARLLTISVGSFTGQASAGGFFPADVEFLNRETGAFLDAVTEGGRKMN